MLKGIQVLQFQGLAPSVFCGHYFADQGAEVTIIARTQPPAFSMPIHSNLMNRYKKCACFSLKDKEDKNIIKKFIMKSNIVIDPYRPGVLQKLGFGPDQLFKINKSVILLRVSGYGQKGPMSLKPGHDLNYISVSGILPLINQKNKQIQFPTNFLADFVSASLGITATLAALKESKETGIGKVVDCALCDGCTYLSKVIKEHEVDKEFDFQSIKIGDKEYCMSGGQVEREKVKKQNKWLEKMGEKKYIRLDNVEISEVCKVPELKTELQNGLNAFGSQRLQKISEIVKRGQHTEQIRAKL